MKKYRCLIIDDERNARLVIRKMLEKHFPMIQIVGEADSVASGYHLIKKRPADLLLLDIKMGDGTGFDLLDLVTDISFSPIFITAYDEYALKAFRVNALDYLLKPINLSSLQEAITKFELSQQAKAYAEQQSQIVIKNTEGCTLLDSTDILRCESDKNYTLFYTQSKSRIVSSKTLKTFDEVLSKSGFLRVHQSHLVNPLYIASFQNHPQPHLILKDGSIIPVSSRKKALVKKFLTH